MKSAMNEMRSITLEFSIYLLNPMSQGKKMAFQSPNMLKVGGANG